MSSLYELTTQYKMLLDYALDPNCDEELFHDSMECLVGDIKDKADGYAKVIKCCERDVDFIKAEVKRLTERRLMLENRVQRMKKALEESMRECGEMKFSTQLFNFSIRKNGGLQPLSVDFDKVPEEFMFVPSPEPDMKKIRDYLKDNSCDWARLEERGESLNIR